MINNDSICSATVVKDSIFNGTRIITVEATYPKFLQAELNTHRMLSKNAASSRAQPTEAFSKNIFVPIHVGVNKAGMSATEYLEGDILSEFQHDWMEIYKETLQSVNYLKEKYNAHKQLINRLLEPFNMTKGIFTGRLEAWNHVLDLRDHTDAQPEIQDLAKQIKSSINLSKPQKLKVGEWHLPYVESKVAGKNDENIKISASCIAQVSYRKLDDSIEKALSIFDKLNLLNDDKNIKKHISPVQHICLASKSLDDLSFYKKYNAEMGENFIQVSKFIENDNLLTNK